MGSMNDLLHSEELVADFLGTGEKCLPGSKAPTRALAARGSRTVADHRENAGAKAREPLAISFLGGATMDRPLWRQSLPDARSTVFSASLSTKFFVASRDHLPDGMFPRGAPGMAMLLLRVALAGSLFIEVSNHWHEPMHSDALAIIAPIAAALAMGVFTSFAASLSAIVGVTLWLMHAKSFPVLEITVLLNAIVVVLLGPGAYSLDAWRFGRRAL